MNRRYFLMSTAVMAGNAAIRGMQSPNETVRVGIAGLGGRGGSHLSGWSGMKNVEVAALCDVDESHIGNKLKGLESRGARKPTVYTDFRQMLESKDVDVVSLATPNHWHTLRPSGPARPARTSTSRSRARHNVFEGAADRRGRPQVQPHRPARDARADRTPALREAMDRMRSGEIGDVYMARGLCYKWRDTIGRTA